MKKKLIALDLDDTTLCSDGTLSAETEAAIRRAIDERFEVVIASGRAFTALPESVIKIPGIRYGVTSNGAAVNSIVDGKRILSNTIGEEDITEALKVIDKFYDGIGVEAFIEGVPYSGREHVAYPERYGCSKAYIHYVQSTRTPVDDIRGFIKEHIHEIDSLDIACPDEVQREEIRRLFRENLKHVYITSSVKHLTEVTHEDAGKANGLKFICDMLGIMAEETVSCGNGDNDIDMMKFTALGAAVSNASENCLAAADLIIGSSNDGGVAKFINDICDGKYD